MASKNKKNFPITFRVDGEQKDYIEQLKQEGTNLRDVLEYYKENNTTKRAKLNSRCKYLVRHINELESELETAKKELKEVRTELGLFPTEDQTNIETSLTANRIVHNCKIKNNGKTDIKTLANYFRTPEVNKILDNAIMEYNIKDPKKFKKGVLKQLKL